MMNKLFFRNDYGEGAHPLVMERLMQTNMEHTCGYGLDAYSLQAADLIREKCGQKDAAVHMMIGGTSANMVALSAFMRPYEAAIAAQGGHINVHETGTVEGSGHKVCIAASRDGKVLPEGVQAVVDAHTDEHMVHPVVDQGPVFLQIRFPHPAVLAQGLLRLFAQAQVGNQVIAVPRVSQVVLHV